MASSFWKGISIDMHSFLHKSRRENHRRVFTQQDTIYSRAHLVLTNLLITSLLVLCFPDDFFCFCFEKFFWFHVILQSYSDICYLGTDELIIFVSFLWMIWLPFVIYLWKPLLMNVLSLVEDQATTSGSTVFIKLSFHFRWFK